MVNHITDQVRIEFGRRGDGTGSVTQVVESLDTVQTASSGAWDALYADAPLAVHDPLLAA